MGKSYIWTEQGARPKRSSSVESLETEEVKHEIFPDSQIGMRPASSHSSRSAKRQRQPRASSLTAADSDEGRPPSRGSRPPSPCRSVHFEDSDSSRENHAEDRPHSRSQSRNQRSSTDSSRQPCNPAKTRYESTSPTSLRDNDSNHMHPNTKQTQQNAYSAIEDPYSTILDLHLRNLSDDQPNEEIQIPDHDINRNKIGTLSRKSLRANGDGDGDWEDSIDGLYAKVEKKRQNRKTMRSGERSRPTDDSSGKIMNFCCLVPCVWVRSSLAHPT